MKKENTEKKLTLEELTTEIQGLFTTSSMAKIRVGELLNEYKEDIKHGGMKAFYESIKISPTTAQYYMKIAGNKTVQKMKKAGELDGMTMAKILEVTGMKKKSNNNGDDKTGELILEPTEEFVKKYMKETSRRVLRAQFGILLNKISELEKKLEKNKAKTP